MNVEFLAMFDSTDVLLRANQMPIEGLEAISELLLSKNNSTFTLTWEPALLKLRLPVTWDTLMELIRFDSAFGIGTYATVWDKQENGEWKAMLDKGNPGLGK